MRSSNGPAMGPDGRSFWIHVKHHVPLKVHRREQASTCTNSETCLDPGHPCGARLRHDAGMTFKWGSERHLANVTPTKVGVQTRVISGTPPTSTAPSLPDAEAAEDVIQHILHIHPAGDTAQRIGRAP